MLGLTRPPPTRTPSHARAHQATADAIEATVPAEPHAPAVARAAVTRWLTDHVDDTVLHDARLLLSELITHCLRHADPGADTPIRFRAHLTETRLRLEVWDIRKSRSLRARASSLTMTPAWPCSSSRRLRGAGESSAS
jgi:anti-sigma regulatory factor (Ser/Thr protein kinase)